MSDDVNSLCLSNNLEATHSAPFSIMLKSACMKKKTGLYNPINVRSKDMNSKLNLKTSAEVLSV